MEVRYNKKHLMVSKRDIDTLAPKIELLRGITKRVYRERIDYYRQQVQP